MTKENPTAWELLLAQSKSDEQVEEEDTPKERKWPDDFRNFGSNVQPQKKTDKLHDGQTIDP